MDTLFLGVDGASRDNSTGMLPALPVPVNYPQSAAFTLMPLQGPDYNASVILPLCVCLCLCLPACQSVSQSCVRLLWSRDVSIELCNSPL